jgi:hypothetical protein
MEIAGPRNCGNVGRRSQSVLLVNNPAIWAPERHPNPGRSAGRARPPAPEHQEDAIDRVQEQRADGERGLQHQRHAHQRVANQKHPPRILSCARGDSSLREHSANVDLSETWWHRYSDIPRHMSEAGRKGGAGRTVPSVARNHRSQRS